MAERTQQLAIGLGAALVLALAGCNDSPSTTSEPERSADEAGSAPAPARGGEVLLRVHATADAPRAIEGFTATARLHGNGVDERWRTTVVRPRTGSRLGAIELQRGNYRVHARLLDQLATPRLLYGCERPLHLGRRTRSRTVVVELFERSCEIRFLSRRGGRSRRSASAPP